jgi:hypothetical protein
MSEVAEESQSSGYHSVSWCPDSHRTTLAPLQNWSQQPKHETTLRLKQQATHASLSRFLSFLRAARAAFDSTADSVCYLSLSHASQNCTVSLPPLLLTFFLFPLLPSAKAPASCTRQIANLIKIQIRRFLKKGRKGREREREKRELCCSFFYSTFFSFF